MAKSSEVSLKIEEVDTECRKFLGEFSEHVLPDVAAPSMKVIIQKLLDMWKVFHEGCSHEPKPFALVDPHDPSKPTLWISPEGDLVVVAIDISEMGARPKPTKISLSQLSQMNLKPTDIVRNIRRQLHFMLINVMPTQPAGQA